MAAPKKEVKIWCEELWMPWDDVDIRKDLNPPKYRPSETHTYGCDDDFEEGYILRGAGAVTQPIYDREHDLY